MRGAKGAGSAVAGLLTVTPHRLDDAPNVSATDRVKRAVVVLVSPCETAIAGAGHIACFMD